MKSLGRYTGILWIIGGALLALAFALYVQNSRIDNHVIVAVADLAVGLGNLGAGFVLRRTPFLVGFVVSAVGWGMLVLAATVSGSFLGLGQALAVVGVVVVAIFALLQRRSRVLLVALAVGALLYFYVSLSALSDVIGILYAALLVVAGVVVTRRGFVGR